MKTTFKSAISILFFIILFAGSSKAQQPVYTQAVSRSSAQVFSRNFSSKIRSVEIEGIEKINPKLLGRFNKNFPRATNVAWQHIGDKYLAIFSINETTIRSLFNKNGKLIYRIDYSSEMQLPYSIKNLVKNNYDDYLITYVARVWQDSREIWVVKLSGQFQYKTVRVENGEMEEVENFKKQIEKLR